MAVLFLLSCEKFQKMFNLIEGETLYLKHENVLRLKKNSDNIYLSN